MSEPITAQLLVWLRRSAEKKEPITFDGEEAKILYDHIEARYNDGFVAGYMDSEEDDETMFNLLTTP